MSLELNTIDHTLFSLALEEDLGNSLIDLTTDTLFDENLPNQQVRIVSKHPTPITVAGLAIFDFLLKQFKTPFTLQQNIHDGQQANAGETICIIQSQANVLLKAERTLLNFLRHLSAIATLTQKFTQQISDTHTKILDTRKTTPGMRHLEKYAVQCGGGCNHRMGLYDAIMIKDTHVDLLGSMEKALAKLPQGTAKKHPVIVEVRSIDELKHVIAHGQGKVDRVLLDNMSNQQLKQCVKLCQNIFATEASGNINLNTIRGIAESGVDFASVGMITHSAGNVDLSMRGL